MCVLAFLLHFHGDQSLLHVQYNSLSSPIRKGMSIRTVHVLSLRYDWLGSVLGELKVPCDWQIPVTKPKEWGRGLRFMLRMYC